LCFSNNIIKEEITMFCKHNDEIIDKTILESAYEQIGKISPNMNSRQLSVGDTSVFFSKKLVILLKCTKCKRVEKIVETNP
jgi:Ca2+-binding EF-hand superfamily protein